MPHDPAARHQLLERPRILTTRTLQPRIASLAHELDLPGLECAALPGEREVAWRDGERLVPRLEHHRPSPSAAPVPGLERGGFYLLSGGRGGIGVEIARFLRQRFAAHLLIVDRSPLPEEAGEAVHHAVVDIADGAGLEALVAERERVWQRPFAGVIHLAGTFHHRLLAEEDRAGLDEVLRPKLAGTWWLYQLLRRRPGGWFLGFSSVVATFGGATLGAYAAANRFLEAFTHHHHQAGDIPSFCFSWSRWVLRRSEQEHLLLIAFAPHGGGRLVAWHSLRRDGALLRGVFQGPGGTAPGYSTDLFDAETIARLMGRFERLLEALVARPKSRLLELPF